MAGSSNYNASKYLNTENGGMQLNKPLTLSEQKQQQIQQDYLREFSEELRAKKWVRITFEYLVGLKKPHVLAI